MKEDLFNQVLQFSILYTTKYLLFEWVLDQLVAALMFIVVSEGMGAPVYGNARKIQTL